MRPIRRLPLIVSLVVLGALGLASASAAGLSLGANPLGVFDRPTGPGTPTVVTWSSFTGATNTSLAGLALDGGGTWTVSAGTWRINANQARSTATARAQVRTSGGSADRTVEVRMTMSGTRRAGVVLNHDGTRYLLVELISGSGGTLRLRKFTGTGFTTLATVTGVGTPTSATLRVQSSGATIQAWLSGTLRITHTLNATTEVPIYKSATATGYGLWANSDGVTMFDDFHIDAP